MYTAYEFMKSDTLIFNRHLFVRLLRVISAFSLNAYKFSMKCNISILCNLGFRV
jgi:hypothetical protein